MDEEIPYHQKPHDYSYLRTFGSKNHRHVFFGVEKSWLGVEKSHWRQHTFKRGEVDLLGTVATMVEIDVYPPNLNFPRIPRSKRELEVGPKCLSQGIGGSP